MRSSRIITRWVFQETLLKHTETTEDCCLAHTDQKAYSFVEPSNSYFTPDFPSSRVV